MDFLTPVTYILRWHKLIIPFYALSKGYKRPKKKCRGKTFLVNLIFHFISARNAAGFSCESSIKLGVCQRGMGLCVCVDGTGVRAWVCGYTLSAFIALAAAVVTHLSLPVKPPSAFIFGR